MFLRDREDCSHENITTFDGEPSVDVDWPDDPVTPDDELQFECFRYRGEMCEDCSEVLSREKIVTHELVFDPVNDE